MLICADARRIPLPNESVQCVVTSPPYWGLRKYAGEQELVWGTWRGAYGLEPTVEMYVEHTVTILREIRRALRKDGVCFWNIGDSYFNCTYVRERGSDAFGNAPGYSAEQGGGVSSGKRRSMARNVAGLKMKDLCLMPARVALAAQADGWWVRSDIIWAKPNPMPESMTDRPTDAYEHILMLTRSGRYFWNAEAVKEQSLSGDIRRPYGSPGAWELDGRSKDKRHGGEPRKNWKTPDGWDTSNGAGGHGTIHRMGREKGHFGYTPKGTHSRGNGDGGPKARARAVEGVHEGWNESTREILETRNMRNVWMFATQPHKGAHFATFPEELPRRCILAASKPGDVILDPFGGSGTTARVAIELQRKPILLDLAYAHDYGPLAKKRTSHVQVQAFV